MDVLHPDLPNSMGMFLTYWDDAFLAARAGGELMLKEGTRSSSKRIPINDAQLLAPVPFPDILQGRLCFPPACGRGKKERRKAEMIAEFDQYPVFYFTNHHSVQGPGDIRCMPDHFKKLDFELEAAIVICKPGRNIKAEEADDLYRRVDDHERYERPATSDGRNAAEPGPGKRKRFFNCYRPLAGVTG